MTWYKVEALSFSMVIQATSVPTALGRGMRKILTKSQARKDQREDLADGGTLFVECSILTEAEAIEWQRQRDKRAAEVTT